MSDPLVHAILPPPDLHRFRELTGVRDIELDVTFAGWSKLAILTDDRVFLFPRRGRDAQLLHGAMVCGQLAKLDIDCVPRVLDQWPDGMLSAGPFVAFERRPGVGWSTIEDDASMEDFEHMVRSLGGAIATWHRLAVSDLDPAIRAQQSFERNPWLNGLLDPDSVDRTVDDLVRLLDAEPRAASTWHEVLSRLSRMSPVLVHGDVCENQLLVDESQQVLTVLDWDTAGVGHPLLDFDFGEWGFGIFEWETDFPRLRRAMWEGYRAGRGQQDLPSADEVNLLFTLSELAYLEQREAELPIDERDATRLEHYRHAIGSATEAVTPSR